MKKLMYISMLIFPMLIIAKDKPVKILTIEEQKAKIENLFLSNNLSMTSPCQWIYNNAVNSAYAQFNSGMRMIGKLGPDYYVFMDVMFDNLEADMRAAQDDLNSCNSYYSTN